MIPPPGNTAAQLASPPSTPAATTPAPQTKPELPRRLATAVFPVAATLVLLASRFVSTSGKVWDVVAGTWADGFTLRAPFWHVVFAPMNGFADVAMALSLRQGIVLIAWFLLGYVAWRCLRGARRRVSTPSWPRLVGRELAMLLAFLLCLAVWWPGSCSGGGR